MAPSQKEMVGVNVIVYESCSELFIFVNEIMLGAIHEQRLLRREGRVPPSKADEMR